MDTAACRRIVASYEEMASRVDEMVAGFYARLFTMEPSIRPLFPADMTSQHEHLAASLALVARNLAHLDVLVEPIMGLGAQHVQFKAQPRHYPMVRDAMLGSMAEVLADRFTPQLRSDWYAALNEIIAIMLQGAVAAAIELTGKNT